MPKKRRFLEEWLPVSGFEGLYEVSNLGRVRSLSVIRNHGGYRPRFIPGRLLRTSRPPNYQAATLWPLSGPPVKVCVHVLVAKHFVSNPLGHRLVRHLDDDRNNNYYKNLAWGTYSDNMLDKATNGRASKKLTPELVHAIRTRLSERQEFFRVPGTGGMFKQTAAEFGIDQSTVISIHNRRTWNHV